MKTLTKKLHDKLLMFNGDTIIICIKEHTASFSGLSIRHSEYKIGQENKLKYVDFLPDTYSNWKIKEVK